MDSAPSAGLEPATSSLEVTCSIHLSYEGLQPKRVFHRIMPGRMSSARPRDARTMVGPKGVTAGMGSGNTLIVDDEEDMRFLLFLAINNENQGLRVVGEAASGDEALTLHRELDVDVVVLDQRMPGRDGLDTARALLAEKPGLPIVLFSAFVDEAIEEMAREIGVSRCIRKGDVPALIDALRKLTGLDSSGTAS